MTPTIVHRYSLPLSDVVRAMLGTNACLQFDAVIVGENLVVDLVGLIGTVEEGDADFAEVADLQPPIAEPEAPPPRKGGPLATRAGILCNEGAFRLWAEVQTPDEAKEFIYRRCGVESRVDLDYEEDAAAKFKEMSLEYQVWLELPE